MSSPSGDTILPSKCLEFLLASCYDVKLGSINLGESEAMSFWRDFRGEYGGDALEIILNFSFSFVCHKIQGSSSILNERGICIRNSCYLDTKKYFSINTVVLDGLGLQ